MSSKLQMTVIGKVKGDRPMRLICGAVFARYGLKAGGTPIEYDDCTATYSISIDGKPPKKSVVNEIICYVSGMCEMWRLVT